MKWKLVSCTCFTNGVLVEVDYESDPNATFDSDILWAEVHHFLEEKFGIGFELASDPKIYPTLQSAVARFNVRRIENASSYF